MSNGLWEVFVPPKEYKAYLNANLQDDIWDVGEPVPPSLKCECGAEATFGKDGSHSEWCPKYDKKEKTGS